MKFSKGFRNSQKCTFGIQTHTHTHICIYPNTHLYTQAREHTHTLSLTYTHARSVSQELEASGQQSRALAPDSQKSSVLVTSSYGKYTRALTLENLWQAFQRILRESAKRQAELQAVEEGAAHQHHSGGGLRRGDGEEGPRALTPLVCVCVCLCVCVCVHVHTHIYTYIHV